MDLFHTLNRGVDKRKIFLDKKDHLRFVHNLRGFNNRERTPDARIRFTEKDLTLSKQKPLVDIHAFCLMPNHYHLLLSPRIDGGIPQFMKKVNMGYAKYFNEKYKRVGALFQGKYKSIAITKEAHGIYIPYYIHLNPLDLISPEWRNKKLVNYSGARDFLKSYRWSSFLDYTGHSNFPTVTYREFLLGVFAERGGHEKDIFRWLKELSLATVSDVALE